MELSGQDEQPYSYLLRTGLEAFRKLCVDGVQAMGINRFIADDRGLFNLRGVNPGDDIIGDLGHDDRAEEEEDPFGPEQC
ncbi:MAG: hypothetical protein KBH07_13670 [Flavobacteriales bacterium]|nr:hypothetical protein [Flavobacteriales bacterium]